MPQPEDDDSYVPSPNCGGLHDDYDDVTGPAFFGIGEHMFTIEELFSEGTARTEVDETTLITIATSSAPPDAPSSSAPPAPRKTKKKGWRQILG
ncbi:hypothetical protein QJS10_CPA01g01791 [Acorus calamus]|uniref:Uncharacterized protein n=1 Tax=Acorus calamus TaxID=4465 RepID=A0AAV9FKR4_ACOCL|nr:hypothetical protein QJS10_CPA01g01791 [Acorus calamus]